MEPRLVHIYMSSTVAKHWRDNQVDASWQYMGYDSFSTDLRWTQDQEASSSVLISKLISQL
jgi:hypothetical protein